MGVMTGIILGTMIAGNIIKARAAAKAAKSEQVAAEANALESVRQENDAVQRGQEGANQMRREVRSIQGTQRTGYGAQGVDLASGTPGAVQASTEGLLQSDLARITRNAERESLGFKAEAENYRRYGRDARSAGRWNVAATLLGGATDTTLLASRMDWKKKTTTPKEGG